MGDVVATLTVRTAGRKTRRVSAYFDSGSPYTFIAEDSAGKVGEAWELAEPRQFRGMGNGRFVSRKAIHLEFVLLGYPCYHFAYLVPRSVIDNDILIGHDFMQNFNIGLDLRRRKIVLNKLSLKRAQTIRRAKPGRAAAPRMRVKSGKCKVQSDG